MEVQDPAGVTEICEKTVDCRRALPRQYAVASEMIDLPAVCFAEDQVSPQFCFSGQLPAGKPFEIVWEIRERAGGRKSSSKTVVLSNEPIRIPLIKKTEAGSLLSIQWHVKHNGVDIGTGTVKFMTPPFDELPTRVMGDSLFGSTGNQLVLLPYRHSGSFAQHPISTKQAFGTLLCVDDFLAAPGLSVGTGVTPFHRSLGRIVDGPNNPVVQYAPSPPWEKSPDAYGPLLKLVQVPAAIDKGTDVVVLSIGLRDLTDLKSAAVFERHIAALSDIVAVSLKHPVIWVTPPPYPGQPGRAREFAVAIRRVADTRRMPVADLYTTFSGMRGDLRPFVGGLDLVLSEECQNLAAQMIVRALLQE
jgi:hypothetical protein